MQEKNSCLILLGAVGIRKGKPAVSMDHQREPGRSEVLTPCRTTTLLNRHSMSKLVFVGGIIMMVAGITGLAIVGYGITHF